MYCRGCGYSLIGLGARACPECGLGFDPADPGSYEVCWPPIWMSRTERATLWILAGWPMLSVAWLHLTLVVARLVLGRWPGRGGMDDPLGIPVVRSMYFVGAAILILIPGTLLVLLVLVGRAALSQNLRVRKTLPTFWLPALLWLLGVLLLKLDPARVVEWFGD